MWQARHVQARLREIHPDCDVQILGMTTEGDRVLDRALSEIGGKGLFTKELEVALLDGRADLAVHSLKDVPMQLGEQFTLAAVLQREDPRDAFVSSKFASLDQMPSGSVLGTSSLRRGAQIKRRYPGLHIQPLRGNLDTRLGKLDRGEYDAIVLAAAGLKRLGLAQRIRAMLPVSVSLPAAGQGALGIETLAGRPDLVAWLQPLVDWPTWSQVGAERVVSRRLGGSCRVPLAAYCEPQVGGGLWLRASISSLDGVQLIEAQASCDLSSLEQAEALGEQVAASLISQGAKAFVPDA